MSPQELAKNLAELVHLDIDAILAYEKALENIDDQAIHTKINQFKNDHLRHVNELDAFIRSLGEQPPEFSRDIKGFFIEKFTAVRSMTGIEGALKAMRSNEKLTNSTYKEALTWKLTSEVRALIEKNYDDEKRHLQYIEQILETHPWEKEAMF